jgi:hypothetical protein
MTTDSVQAAPPLVVDRETIAHLPPLHKAIAEVLIERGRWTLAEGGIKSD